MCTMTVMLLNQYSSSIAAVVTTCYVSLRARKALTPAAGDGEMK